MVNIHPLVLIFKIKGKMKKQKGLNYFFYKKMKHGMEYNVFKKYELLNKTDRLYNNNEDMEKKVTNDQMTIGKLLRIGFIFVSSTLLLLTGFYLLALIQNERLDFMLDDINVNDVIQFGIILQAIFIIFVWSVYNYLIINNKDNKIVTIILAIIKSTLAYKSLLLINNIENAIKKIKDLKIDKIDITILDCKMKMYYKWKKQEIREYINNLIDLFERQNNTKLTTEELKEIQLIQKYYPTNIEKNVLYLNKTLEYKLQKQLKVETWNEWLYNNAILIKDFVGDLFTEKYYYLGYFITASIAMYIYVRTNENNAQEMEDRVSNLEKRMNGDHLGHIYEKVTNDNRFIDRMTDKVLMHKTVPVADLERKKISIYDVMVDFEKAQAEMRKLVSNDLGRFQRTQKSIAEKLSDLMQRAEYLDNEKIKMQDQINELIRRSKSILINSNEIIDKS